VHAGTDHLSQPEGVMYTSSVLFIPTQPPSSCSLKLFPISTYSNAKEIPNKVMKIQLNLEDID